MQEELQRLREENEDLRVRLDLALFFIRKTTEIMKLFSDDFHAQAKQVEAALHEELPQPPATNSSNAFRR